MNLAHCKVYVALTTIIYVQTEPWRTTLHLPAFDLCLGFFWGSCASCHHHVVVRPWGHLSLLGFCETSLNSAITLHRAAGSSSGTGIIRTCAFSSTGYRQRHVHAAGLRQGYV